MEAKSELWSKFYEEEKTRLEQELLQSVFGHSARLPTPPSSSHHSEAPTIAPVQGFSDRKPIKHVIRGAETAKSGTAIDEMRSDMARKWAEEYVVASSSNQNMTHTKKKELLEALMKMRGAVQCEHENLLCCQREALVKKAEMELQVSQFQDQDVMEKQYKEYVMRKLLETINHNFQLSDSPSNDDCSPSASLPPVDSILSNIARSEVDAYIARRSSTTIHALKALVTQYSQRKLSTVSHVLTNPESLRQAHIDVAHNVSTAESSDVDDNVLKSALQQRMAETVKREKSHIHQQLTASTAAAVSYLRPKRSRDNARPKASDVETWEKGLIVFQRNVALAGQIALLQELHQKP